MNLDFLIGCPCHAAATGAVGPVDEIPNPAHPGAPSRQDARPHEGSNSTPTPKRSNRMKKLADWFTPVRDTLTRARDGIAGKVADFDQAGRDRQRLISDLAPRAAVLTNYDSELGTRNSCWARRTYSESLRRSEQLRKQSRHFVVVLTPGHESIVNVTGFRAGEQQMAMQQLFKEEKKISDLPGAEAVMVSARSIDDVVRGYPAYFVDTRQFLDALRREIS